MADLTKLAAFLDSFTPDNSGYDAASYIKAKIADVQGAPAEGQENLDDDTIHNTDEALDDADVTSSTNEDKSQENIEGDYMKGAFRDLDVMNELDEEKNKVIPNGDGTESLNNQGSAGFTSVNPGSNLQKKASTMFELLRRRLK